MFTSAFVLVSTLLVDTASAHKDKGNDWDPAAATALEGKIRTMFKEFDSGNMDGTMAWADTTAISWDIGMEGEPIAANTREETQKMLDGYSKMIKEGGVTVKTTVNKVNCHSTADFGFCVVEFDQAITAGGAPQPDAKFRATAVARTVDGQWRWSHWHASMREPMAMHDASAQP